MNTNKKERMSRTRQSMVRSSGSHPETITNPQPNQTTTSQQPMVNNRSENGFAISQMNQITTVEQSMASNQAATSTNPQSNQTTTTAQQPMFINRSVNFAIPQSNQITSFQQSMASNQPSTVSNPQTIRTTSGQQPMAGMTPSIMLSSDQYRQAMMLSSFVNYMNSFGNPNGLSCVGGSTSMVSNLNNLNMNLTENNSNVLFLEDPFGQNSSSSSSGISTAASDSFLDLTTTDIEETVCYAEKIEEDTDTDSDSLVECIDGKKMVNGVAYYNIKWKGSNEKAWIPSSALESSLVTRYEKASRSHISIHSLQGSSCHREPYVPVKQKASVESIGPVLKRRKLRGVEYETHSMTLSEETVSKNYEAGKIITVAASESEQNFEMYNVVRRLKSVESGAIINHFFRCEICETVLKVVTALNHVALTRHFRKCVGPVQIDRNILYDLIKDVLQIGVQFGPCDLSKAILPSKIDGTNIASCMEKLRSTAEATAKPESN